MTGLLEQHCQLFADDAAHRAHHKARLHRENRAGIAAHRRRAGDNALPLARFGGGFGQLLVIAGEVEAVGRAQRLADFAEAALVAEQREPFAGAHAEMVAAVGADGEVGEQVTVEERLAAGGAEYTHVRRNRRTRRFGDLLLPFQLVFRLFEADHRLFSSPRKKIGCIFAADERRVGQDFEL